MDKYDKKKTQPNTNSVSKNQPNPEILKENFLGERMIYVMRIRNISCKELAKRMYVSPSTITGYRIGRRNPDVTTLTTIASELNVSLDYLVGLKPDPEKLYPDQQ